MLRIGRSMANDHLIPHPSVSGLHCELTLDEEGNLFVRDTGSTNGTFVDGQKVSEALMKPGQVLRLGEVELVFETSAPLPVAQRAQPPPAAAPSPPSGDAAQPPAALECGDSPASPASDLSTEPDPTLAFSVSTPTGCRTLLDHAGHAVLTASFAPGVTLQERYVLEHELGRGNMGQVFLARDIRLNRPVAIKVIALRDGQAQPSLSVRPELRQAFEQEARLGASLNHPAIATVFDYGFHEEKPFTVFEYIEGLTLREFIRGRPRIPLDETLLIVAPLAQALDYAHSNQVVHRDLKPANIRATPQGYFKILDLGLAKQIQQLDKWAGFAGTPAYASPEQAAGLPVDGRTDQYALAVIVYEMLTGQRPFWAHDITEMLRLQREVEVPDPQLLLQDIPESVEIRTALLRALNKDPNQRFASCEAFAVALRCQLLSTVAPQIPILLEADVRTHRRFRLEVGPESRRHLVLAPDAVWCDHDGEVERWALHKIGDVQRSGRDLQIAVGRMSSDKNRLTFSQWWFKNLIGL
jgi:hypothetical protein